MKQLTSYNRIAGFLNKLFDMLNERFFENELERPVITLQSTPRAYAHFCTRPDTWVNSAGQGFYEINMGAGTLNRPIENICASMLHEMTHYYCCVKGIKDTSNNGVYHNHRFKDIAEKHGLIIDRHNVYGWTITSPGDELLTWVLENSLQEILLNRNELHGISISGGSGTHSPNTYTTTPRKGSHSHKLVCPGCGAIARVTKPSIRLMCMDCMEQLVES